MNKDQREYAINQIGYFGGEYTALERWSGWDAAKSEFPEVEKAWNDYKEARRKFHEVVENLTQ